MSSGLVFCSQCATPSTNTARFCARCGTAIQRHSTIQTSTHHLRPSSTKSSITQSIEEPDDDLSILFTRATPIPNHRVRPSSAITPTTLPSRASEVQHHRHKAGITDKGKEKAKTYGISGYGVNVKAMSNQNMVKRHAELYIAEAGQVAKRLPSSFELLSFNTREHVPDWASWIRERCVRFVGWTERKDPNLMVEDFTRRAWVGYLEKGSSGPIRVNIPDGDAMTVQLLFDEISEKLRLIFVLPIEIWKESELEELEDEKESLGDEEPTIFDSTITRLKLNSPKLLSQHRVKRQRSGLFEEVTTLKDSIPSRSSSGLTPDLPDEEDLPDIERVVGVKSEALEVIETEPQNDQALSKDDKIDKKNARKEVLKLINSKAELRRSER